MMLRASLLKIFQPFNHRLITWATPCLHKEAIRRATPQSLGEQLAGLNRITPNFRKTKAVATFTKLPLVLANGASHQSCRWCLGETSFFANTNPSQTCPRLVETGFMFRLIAPRNVIIMLFFSLRVRMTTSRSRHGHNLIACGPNLNTDRGNNAHGPCTIHDKLT